MRRGLGFGSEETVCPIGETRDKTAKSGFIQGIGEKGASRQALADTAATQGDTRSR